MYINWLIILLVQADPHVSIQKLTEKFVTDLQEDYPATVSTIFRTGDKLSMGSSITETSECCALCQVCGMYSTNIHMEISREAYKYYTNTK
jgi:cytoplasmic tRNA 2-thiolation protein 2